MRTQENLFLMSCHPEIKHNPFSGIKCLRKICLQCCAQLEEFALRGESVRDKQYWYFLIAEFIKYGKLERYTLITLTLE